MSLIVQKFGGSSVADANKLRNVARIITDTYQRGNDVVVVLSAQGDTTDDLIEKAKELNPHASKREMDMLLSTGEQISISLCAMCIESMGYQAISLTGWQAGMLTDSSYSNARIKRVRTERIQKELDKRKIVLVAGFQGINKYDDITTLGRGGSDTSAVALALPDGDGFVVSGECYGMVALAPSGEGGFGYDCVFFYAPEGCTFADMSEQVKNRVSHRAVAMRLLVEQLERSAKDAEQ